MSREISESPFLAFALCTVVTVAAIASPARSQCQFDWLPSEPAPGVTGDLPVWSMVPWDPDGAGLQPEVLVAAGGFATAGDVNSFGIAIWDGSDWQSVDEQGGHGRADLCGGYTQR